MVKRYFQEEQLRPVNMNTGAAGGMLSLADRLQAFGQQTDQLAGAIGAKIGQKEAQEVEYTKNEEGITQAPEYRKTGVIDGLLTGGARNKTYNATVRDGYLASLENDLRANLSEIEQTNRDSLTTYNEEVEGLINGVLQGVDPESRPAVQQFLDTQVTNARIRIQGRTLETNREQANASRREAINTAGDQSATLAREGDMQGSADALRDAFANIDGMVETGDLDSDQATEMKRSLEREATEQGFRFRIDAQADEEGIDAAMADLESMRNTVPRGWTPDEWDTFVASAQADLNAKAARLSMSNARTSIETSREISNLRIQARTGTGEPSDIITRTEELFDQGLIPESMRTSIITDVIQQQQEMQSDAEAIMRVNNRLAGNPEQVVSQQDVDLAWDTQIAPVLATVDPELRNATIEDFVDNTKIIPTQVKTRITSGLNSMDPALVAEAAGLMDRLDSVRGIEDTPFSPNERAFAETVVALSANMDPQEAVNLARRNTDPNDSARVEMRQQILDDEEYNYASKMEDGFNPWFAASRVDSINQGRMTQEYQNLFDEHFKAGMNESQAHNKAIQIMQRNWGESSVTGRTRAMKYPPEWFYSVAGKADYIGEQLLADVAGEGNIWGEDITLNNIYLVADQYTSRTASTGRPQYIVQVMTEQYGLVTLPDPWTPDMQAEIARQQADNQRRLEQLRQGQPAANFRDSAPRREFR